MYYPIAIPISIVRQVSFSSKEMRGNRYKENEVWRCDHVRKEGSKVGKTKKASRTAQGDCVLSEHPSHILQAERISIP